MVAIYARQSVDKDQSISIETQIEICKKELYENEPFKVYQDKGYSGKNTLRPEFQEMMDDIRNGLITKVIIYKLDRISRNTLDFGKIMEVLTSHKVEFVSCSEKFDTSSVMGKAMLGIVMIFAELERETIAERIRDSYYARGRRGFYGGGRVPYGFNKVETHIDNKKTSMFVENKEQADIIRLMYKMYDVDDMSLYEITRYLNNNKIPSPSGCNWDSSKLSRIMKNPAYVKADINIYTYYKSKKCIIENDISDFIGENGCYLYGKRKSSDRKYTNVEDHVLVIAPHKGIIDSYTFLRCLSKFASNKQIQNSGRGKYSWLSGLIKCGKCGGSITTKRVSKLHVYGRCSGQFIRQDCDGLGNVHLDEIESVVEEQIFYFLNNDAEIICEDTSAGETKELNEEALKIDAQIDKLLELAMESDNVASKYINEKINKLHSQKLNIEMKIQEIISSKSKINAFKLVDILQDWSNLSFEDKKKIVSQIIEKVSVFEDNTIDIMWKQDFRNITPEK